MSDESRFRSLNLSVGAIKSELKHIKSDQSKLESGFAALAVSNKAMVQAITDLSSFLETRQLSQK